MNEVTSGIFRAAAIEKLSSPEQLDQLVGVTRPVDWLSAVVIVLAVLSLILWGFFGKLPTRLAGEGIVIGDRGRIVDAVAAGSGRLGALDVAVSDEVNKGQLIAH